MRIPSQIFIPIETCSSLVAFLNIDVIQPVTSVLLHIDEVSGEYRYNVPFIEVGDYTISLTCNADLEDIETDEEIETETTGSSKN